MTITFDHFKPREAGNDFEQMVVVVGGEGSIARFRELVQRGTNLWPDAHPEVKEFADKVTVGHVQQDYQQQAPDIHKRKI